MYKRVIIIILIGLLLISIYCYNRTSLDKYMVNESAELLKYLILNTELKNNIIEDDLAAGNYLLIKEQGYIVFSSLQQGIIDACVIYDGITGKCLFEDGYSVINHVFFNYEWSKVVNKKMNSEYLYDLLKSITKDYKPTRFAYETDIAAKEDGLILLSPLSTGLPKSYWSLDSFLLDDGVLLTIESENGKIVSLYEINLLTERKNILYSDGISYMTIKQKRLLIALCVMVVCIIFSLISMRKLCTKTLSIKTQDIGKDELSVGDLLVNVRRSYKGVEGWVVQSSERFDILAESYRTQNNAYDIYLLADHKIVGLVRFDENREIEDILGAISVVDSIAIEQLKMGECIDDILNQIGEELIWRKEKCTSLYNGRNITCYYCIDNNGRIIEMIEEGGLLVRVYKKEIIK